ncbi:MAG: zinc metallopeptidase [Oscillospiraceae bacterium]|nr:zinc metallopeptidase [Oscillospiraceae bacterium]MBQ5323275.1 zinc metallopeptidase [Oscillospiraceae bacterium]
MFYGFDIYYFILIIHALLFGLWAQSQVNTNFQKYSQIGTMRGMTGAQAAEYILQQNGIYDVQIRHVSGHLSDNFNPRNKTINLSDSVYNSTSIAAIGVAAHEAGHAVQHAVNYAPIRIREMIIPVTQIGSWLYLPIIMVGFLFSSQALVNVGILLFSTLAIFQLVTLPVEFDASGRAIRTLESSGILYGEEITGAKKVLKAAALTYVAALVSSLAQLLRLILIFGGRRRD